MIILDWLKSLVRHLDKDDIMEDVRCAATELQTVVTPSYEEALTFFGTKKFTNAGITKIERQFVDYYKPQSPVRKQGNIVADIQANLKGIQATVSFIDEQLELTLAADVIKDGITVKRAFLLRAVDQISLFNRNAVDLLNYIYVLESMKDGETVRDYYSPKVLERINSLPFISVIGTVMSVYGQPVKSFKEQYESIPEVVINEKTAGMVASVYRDDKIDPMGRPAMRQFQGSPIYHLGLVAAEYQVVRYQSFAEKKKMLELRLLYLKTQLENGATDPKIEQEIQYSQKRVDDIEAKMRDMEG